MANLALAARLYQKMLLIRQVELRIAEIYHTDAIKSPVHLSVGQEALAIAECEALNKDDIVSNTYRCHATYIAKGGDLNAMMAELYGKRDGCAGGKAGSMHLIDYKNGVLGASAVVGTTIPIAAGLALAFKQDAKEKKQQRLVVSVFGDGATEEGCFPETLNFAALHQLPVLFFCENNRLAIHTPVERRWATEKLCERVATYGIETHKITNPDIFALIDTVTEAVEKIRNKKSGPIFIECATYRWLEHVGPRDDHEDDYRCTKEYQRWKDDDQLIRLGNMLDPKTREQIDRDVEKMIADAQAFAEKSPYPGIEELHTHVYAD